ncbi:MAG: phosphonate ABC transporter ATP-binding protein [Hyphomicrobiaceae bacterium]
MSAAVELQGVSKSFKRGSRVLDRIELKIEKGEMVALIGASGSGKSTLIRTIAGLISADRTDEALVSVLGTPIQRGGRIAGAANDLRSRIGVVFQQFNLVPRLTVLTNVCLGRLGQIGRLRGTLGRFSDDDRRRAMYALGRVGIADQALKRGSELSGGQQQRAAIARSLVQGADVLIADEPIASLDPNSARRVMDILADLNRKDGITVLVSLHQVEYALLYCPRTIALRQGRIVYDGPSDALTPSFLGELYGAESEKLILSPSVGRRDAREGAPTAGRSALVPTVRRPMGPAIEIGTSA